MIIFNAIFYEKKLLFSGHGLPAGTVSSHVLSACCMVPMFHTLLADRAYPYISLNCLDFIKTPGYIAGVTNPMFKARKEWWDVFCDLTNGDVLTKDDSKDQTLTCSDDDDIFIHNVSE